MLAFEIPWSPYWVTLPPHAPQPEERSVSTLKWAWSRLASQLAPFLQPSTVNGKTLAGSFLSPNPTAERPWDSHIFSPYSSFPIFLSPFSPPLNPSFPFLFNYLPPSLCKVIPKICYELKGGSSKPQIWKISNTGGNSQLALSPKSGICLQWADSNSLMWTSGKSGSGSKCCRLGSYFVRNSCELFHWWPTEGRGQAKRSLDILWYKLRAMKIRKMNPKRKKKRKRHKNSPGKWFKLMQHLPSVLWEAANTMFGSWRSHDQREGFKENGPYLYGWDVLGCLALTLSFPTQVTNNWRGRKTMWTKQWLGW